MPSDTAGPQHMPRHAGRAPQSTGNAASAAGISKPQRRPQLAAAGAGSQWCNNSQPSSAEQRLASMSARFISATGIQVHLRSVERLPWVDAALVGSIRVVHNACALHAAC